MKKDIHSNDYRPVVFEDLNNGFKFLTRSTVKTTETIKWEDGQEYPLVKVHISSASHPFFTGQEKLLDVEGRVDKFKARREAAEKAKSAKLAATKTPKKLKTKQPKDELKTEAETAEEAKEESKELAKEATSEE
jgi:large subunit ribosomal protein L31